MADPHEILGVPHDATPDEIQRAFRKLARACHPDCNPEAAWAEEAMRRLLDARDTLLRPHQHPPAPARDPTAQDGPDVWATVVLRHAEATRGTRFQRTYHRPDGTPYLITVSIPAGISHGAELRVPGAGVRGLHGGRAGDFVLRVLIADA